jgi:hypothetical protein
MRNGRQIKLFLLLIPFWLSSCQAAAGLGLFSSATPTPTLTPKPSATATLTPTPTNTATSLPPTSTPTITATAEPFGCLKPPEDYTRIQIHGWTINQRTFAMLKHAAELYGGEIYITSWAITQGSYHDNGAASFGTHLGGGAVDLSVMRKNTWTILRGDLNPLVKALRAAGFAAWYRELEELFPGSSAHIHAIAIGDRELSQPAKDQLTGKFGYFRGYSGVPIPNGTPAPDRYGGPVLCQWMIDMGYKDLRKNP